MTTVRTIESVPYSRVLADALAVPGTNTMRVAEDFFGLADIVKGSWEEPPQPRCLRDGFVTDRLGPELRVESRQGIVGLNPGKQRFQVVYVALHQETQHPTTPVTCVENPRDVIHCRSMVAQRV